MLDVKSWLPSSISNSVLRMSLWVLNGHVLTFSLAFQIDVVLTFNATMVI